MKRIYRLRTPIEFQRVRDAAPRGWPHPFFVLLVAPNDLDRTRIGITVSGRVGNAVVRNKVRRRIREALRARLPRLASGRDILVLARPAVASASWTELNTALDTLLHRSGATQSDPAAV